MPPGLANSATESGICEPETSPRGPEQDHTRRHVPAPRSASGRRRADEKVLSDIKKPLSLDPLGVEVGQGVGRLGWAEFAGAVGSSTAVMLDVLGEHGAQMPLAQDQHAVGEFGWR